MLYFNFKKFTKQIKEPNRGKSSYLLLLDITIPAWDIWNGGSCHVAVNWLRMAGKKDAGNLPSMTPLSTELTNLKSTYLGNNHIG